MSDPATITDIQALGGIILGGVLGTAGQGLRAIVELRGAGNAAGANPAPGGYMAMTNRLVFGLLVGFVVGVITALGLGLNTLATLDPSQLAQATSPLVVLLLAGYAGADAVDGLIAKFVPQ